MQATFTVDTTAFQRTLREYAKRSSKTFQETVNNKAYQLAGGFGNKGGITRGALQLTYRADPAKIARELSREVKETYRIQKRTGKMRLSRRIKYDKDTFAARIINWRRKAKGEQPIWGKELLAAAKKMVGARIRSVAFIKSGWLPAIAQLQRFVPGARPMGQPYEAGIRIKRNNRGYAIPATQTFQPKARIVNQSMNLKPRVYPGRHSPARVMTIAQTGLRKAVALVTADMMNYIKRKMKADAPKSGVVLRG